MPTKEHVRAVAEPHLLAHDMDVLAPDVVYVDASTGEEARGREAAAAITAYYNREAFEAVAGEPIRTAYTEDGTALLELAWRGKHVGDFEGLAPTDRVVEAQVCLVASVEGDHVRKVNLYFPRSHVLRQLRD